MIPPDQNAAISPQTKQTWRTVGHGAALENGNTENPSTKESQHAEKKSAEEKAAHQAEFIKKLLDNLVNQAKANESLQSIKASFTVEPTPRNENKADEPSQQNNLAVNGVKPEEDSDNIFKITMKYIDDEGKEKEAVASMDMASSPPRIHVNPNDPKSIEAAMHATKAAGGTSVMVSQEFKDKNPEAFEQIQKLSKELGMSEPKIIQSASATKTEQNSQHAEPKNQQEEKKTEEVQSITNNTPENKQTPLIANAHGQGSQGVFPGHQQEEQKQTISASNS